MRKLLTLFLPALMLLCSCAAPGSADISINTSTYQTDISDVSAQGIEFSEMKDRVFEEELNSIIASDIDGALISFDTLASQSNESLRMGNRCVFRLTQDVKYNKNNFISIIEEHYIYTGGAHGSSKRYPRNIDLASSRTVCLSDLFESGYEDTINRMIKEAVDAHPELYSDLWEQPSLSANHQKDFYISDDKLVIFFQPYDLSYYAKGYVEFPLRLKDLSGYMKEEYRRLVPG